MKREEKMVGLLYKLTKTCDPRTPDSFYLGGTRMCDIPQLIDEFMRVWHMDYDKKMRRFWIFRPAVEWLFINERFITFTEYQELFKGTHTTGLASASKLTGKSVDDLYTRHPAFRIAGISSERRRQEFILNYKDDLSSYFELMRKKNRTLYIIFTSWHKVAIAKENRIHSWITGTPGSGKSELMKSMILQDIRQNMKKDCSIVIIDPNGDFAKEVAQFKENTDPIIQEKLVYIDLDLFKGEYTPVINPFQLHDNANRDREIDLTNQQIAKALEEICNSFGQPLTSQMQTILYNCTSVLLERDNSSLWDLQTMVNPAKNSPTAQPFIDEGRNSFNPATRSFFRQVWESVTSFKDSKAGIYTKTQRLLNMPSFSNMVTGESTINLKDAIDSNKLIIFNLAVGNLGDQAPLFIGKILISLLQSISFQKAGLEKEERKPVYLYIDEFQDFVSDSMIRILTQGRKYKMYLTIANQFVGQDMTTNEQDAILGTTKVKIIGGNSNKSHSTLSRETDAEIDLLKKLKLGQFMVKVAEAEPFILSSPTESLDNKNSMSKQEWEKVVAQQKKKYYRKKPINDILAQMIFQENNPQIDLLQTPPTDESVKQDPNRTTTTKPDLDVKFEDEIPPQDNQQREDDKNDDKNDPQKKKNNKPNKGKKKPPESGENENT